MATTRQTKKENNGRQEKKRPVFSRKYFPVQVAVFEYEHEGRLNHSVSLTRSFRRDEESDWETTPYLGAADLLPASKLLSEAYSFIQRRLQQAYDEGRNGQGSSEPLSADFDF